MKDLNYYRNLLMRLEDIVYKIECNRVKEVVKHLRRYEEGTNTCEDSWVFESPIYIKSRLIQKWHSLSMNDSL